MKRFLAATKALIFIPIAILGLLQPYGVLAATSYLTNGSFSAGAGGWSGATGGAGCSQGKPSMGEWEANSLNFSYITNTVSQTVIVASPSTLTLTYSVQNRAENWIEGKYTATLADSNQTATSGQQTAPMSQTEFTLSVTTTEVNESVTVSFTGDDGPTVAWAGCYGPAIRNVSLSGTSSFAPVLKWIELNEGWSGTLSAPSGTFTSVVFASYGTPSGQDGQYSLGSCHAQNSRSIIESLLIGQQSAVINASNSIFGDPCGGTYKRLYVAAEYTPTSAPTTTTSTTTTLPTCGPYDNLTVTGKSSGAVWGSGPYTDDSDFGVAAVHAGLAAVGQTVTLTPSNVAYHLSYSGSTANGVTTADWLSGWCGYDINLLVPPTTTTTTTVPETTTTQTTSTTSTTTTSTTEAPEPSTTVPETVPEEVTTTTDTSVPETTTTQETVPQEEITTPETSAAPDPTPETTDPEPSPATTDPEEVPTTIQEQDAAETTIPKPAPEPQNEEATDAEVALEALSSAEELTDEQLVEAVDAVLADGITAEAVSELVDAIESGTLEADQVQAVVDAILEEEITNEVATELATSSEVIQNVTQEQATEIFAAIDEGALTEEQGAEIVAAVQDAPTEVRQAFEAQINIFGGATDTYVPVGSSVSVGVRRVIVAATAAVFVAPAAASASRKR